MNCGTVASDSVIVNEISFGEAASGAPLVQGTTVHDGQRFARSTGIGFRRGGRTSEETNENAMRVGKDELTRLANALQIMPMFDKAYNLYQLARMYSFQRPIKENAAICLYLACRQTKGNTTMLIDFAEQVKMNVFDLGATYKKFLGKLDWKNNDKILMDKDIPIIEIEPLLLKFARRMEFGESTKQVANDAASILARMNRDWMVTGRQPMGLCGACLILAARMNNFRRSVREVVYVVKAADTTIIKRLNEFQRTEAGRLTVQDFRKYGMRLKNTHEPPSMTESQAAKRQRRVLELQDDEPITPLDEFVVPPARDGSATPGASIEPLRRDADGFAIPNLPVDREQSQRSISASYEPSSDEEESETEEIPLPKKRGRKPKIKLAPVDVRPEDLVAESELEKEIEHLVEAAKEGTERFNTTEARAAALAKVEIDKQRRVSTWHHRTVPDSEIIDDDEFEDDPEVAHCLLDEKEIEVKERIWVTHNHDWLRAQQDRLLKEQMEEAKGKRKRMGPARKMPVRGDGSILGSTPVESPAEASHRMVQKRAPRAAFSKHLDYDKLKLIYNEHEPTGSETSPTSSTPSVQSRRSSYTRSVSASPAPVSRGRNRGLGRGRARGRGGISRTTQQLLTPAITQETTAGASQEKPVEIPDDPDLSDAETIEEDDNAPRPALPTFGDDDDDENEMDEEDYDDYNDILEAATELGIDPAEALIDEEYDDGEENIVG
jgi:transcription factor IIIB subunit 2